MSSSRSIVPDTFANDSQETCLSDPGIVDLTESLSVNPLSQSSSTSSASSADRMSSPVARHLQSMKISNFFRPIPKEDHLDNALIDLLRMKRKDSAKEKDKQKQTLAMEQQRSAAKRKRAVAFEDLADTNLGRQFIMDLTEGREEVVLDSTVEKRRWTKRPANWNIIAHHYIVWGKQSTIDIFGDLLGDRTPNAIDLCLAQWRKDFENGVDLPAAHPGPPPCYGAATDAEVYAQVIKERSVGLPVDDRSLYNTVKSILVQRNQQHLMREFGGKNSFGHGFCQRFFKRFNLVTRVANTKMRDAPADFEAKKDLYVKIAAQLVAKHDVPPALVIGCDETSVLFCPRASRTKHLSGARRVRVIGVGSEKAALTATLFITETGVVLDYQMIFAGLTSRSLPRHAKPADCLWSHSKSHWQTPQTFVDAIESIVVPYKNRIIAEANLPANQVMILKLDLHYSHLAPAVLAHCRLHNIALLYVPAGCTDLLQECDTVLNKPFKAAVRGAFRDHLHEAFEEYLNAVPARDPSLWRPLLTMGALKPHITSFVTVGVAALKSPDMQATIRTAFADDGLFALIRSAAVQALAHEQLQSQRDFLDIAVPPVELAEQDEEDDFGDEEIDELLNGLDHNYLLDQEDVDFL